VRLNLYLLLVAFALAFALRAIPHLFDLVDEVSIRALPKTQTILEEHPSWLCLCIPLVLVGDGLSVLRVVYAQLGVQHFCFGGPGRACQRQCVAVENDSAGTAEGESPRRT
jgi:hypothetical protein